MLEHIFGSKSRLKLLRFWFNHPEKAFFVRELAKKIEAPLNAVRREIDHLLKAHIIIQANPEGGKKNIGEARRKYYRLNEAGALNGELQTLLAKAQYLSEQHLVDAVKNFPSLDYLALSGKLVGLKDSETDLLIVGNISQKELRGLITMFEKESASEVRYTLMNTREFLYRRDVADKFLTNLLENKHIVVVDRKQGRAQYAS